HGSEIGVEHLDAGEEVKGNERTLFVAVIGGHNSHRDTVHVRDTRSSTQLSAGRSERTNRERQGVLVEGEVVSATFRSVVDQIIVRETSRKRTIQKDQRLIGRSLINIQ